MKSREYFELVIASQANDDTIEVVDYYDQINPDLTDRFLSELGDVFNKLKINPHLYSLIREDKFNHIREVRLKSFPFLVIY